MHLPNLVPNRSKMTEYGSKTDEFFSKVKEIRVGLRPDPDMSK